MIPLMLCAQWIATVVIATMIMGSSTWAFLLSFMNTLCLWSINYLARELEMPYGDDPDDLPLYHLQADMNASLTGLLHPMALRPPSFELPMSEEGSVRLQAGIVEIQEDGTMNFRPDGPDGGRGFHVPRVVIGKNKTFKRGPTQEASARRAQMTRANTRMSSETSAATGTQVKSQSAGMSSLDRPPTKCTTSTATQEYSATLKPSLESSTSLGQRKNADTSLRHDRDRVKVPGSPPPVNESSI
mmetsp:Transcript_11731/g.21501  ORF Transcript_11731/g.21501 Transcript_11731/m.21501 type:complete len:243 (-) Transcript_11731:48-776(-)